MLSKIFNITPFFFLFIALAQVVGFIAAHEPYLAGAWTVTSATLVIMIIFIQLYKNAVLQIRAHKESADYLAQVLGRRVERDLENEKRLDIIKAVQ